MALGFGLQSLGFRGWGLGIRVLLDGCNREASIIVQIAVPGSYKVSQIDLNMMSVIIQAIASHGYMRKSRV